MNTELLLEEYQENRVLKSICDNLANRPKNQNETLLHRMLAHLESDGLDIKKSDVIAAFRKLEETECGQYVEGRHGWKSRFVWNVKSKHVASVARGEDSDSPLYDPEEYSDEEMIEHTYCLRPELIISFELPTDISLKETQRLSQFVGSLSFEE